MDVNRKPEFLSHEAPMDFKDERKSFRCPQCKYVTDRKNNLKRHIITMHQESSKSLECCGVLFKSKALLRDHVSLFHRGGYCCQICGRNFCRKALLHRHLTVHSGQKDFSCSQCGYATSHKSNLERHQKVHLRCGDGTHNIFDHSSDEDRFSNYLTESSRGSSRRKMFRKNLNRHLLLPKRLAHTYHSEPENASPKEDTDDLVPECDEDGITDVSKKDDNPSADDEDQCPKDLKIPKRRYSTTVGNSKRMFYTPYKCNVCNRHFRFQLEFFRHQCISRERHQPTLPFTNAYKRKKPETKEEIETVQESTISPKSPKPNGVIDTNSGYRKRRSNDFRFSHTCAQKIPCLNRQTNNSHCSLDYSKTYNTSPHSFHEKFKPRDDEFQNTCISLPKPLKQYDAFADTNFMNLCRIPSKQVSGPVHFYPYNTFSNNNVKNVDFWRVW